MPLAELHDILRCPVHLQPLEVPAGLRGVRQPWPDGELRCPKGCTYPVLGGIPRFTAHDHYANAFGLQWRRYQRTQLDSRSGGTYSLERLERCLGAPVASLRDRSVLECGAGAGRFTEWLSGSAGSLVSLDLSDAVDANLKNCVDHPPYLLVQADMNKAPLPKQAFDVVFCLGVLQHTPSPETSMRSLASYVKPGGLLVIDHYAKRPFFGSAGQYLTLGFPLREVLKRVSPEAGLKATIAITKVCDPIRKRTSKYPALDLVVSRLLPTACYYQTFPDMPEDLVYEWNELDTHDGLTDWYKHRRSPTEIDRFMGTLGLETQYCEIGSQGVEARARRPLTA